jgi:hypothetical protein
MTEDELYRLKYLRLVVTTMREKQKLFFSTKSPQALRDSKELEKRVDKLLEEMLRHE